MEYINPNEIGLSNKRTRVKNSFKCCDSNVIIQKLKDVYLFFEPTKPLRDYNHFIPFTNGDTIRSLRRSRHLTQEEFANELNKMIEENVVCFSIDEEYYFVWEDDYSILGPDIKNSYTKNIINRIESDHQKLTTTDLFCFSKFFDIPVDELINSNYYRKKKTDNETNINLIDKDNIDQLFMEKYKLSNDELNVIKNYIKVIKNQ